MNLHCLIRSRTALAAIGGVVLAAGIMTFRAQADVWDKKTILTVNQEIQVRDTVLEPGQYVFKLLDSPSNRHVVQIFNRDQSHIINTILAIPKQRMDPTDKSEFTFWETPPGTARAMRAWFYPGDTIGQEFPYPKHLKQIAMATTTTTTASSSASSSSSEETKSEAYATPEPAPPPPAAEQETVKENEQVEIAQAAPPPAPAAPAPEPAPQRSTELPKTGSPYPLIGLSGLVLIGLSGLLRLRGSA